MDAFIQGFGWTFGIACGLLGVAMLIIGICYVMVYGASIFKKKRQPLTLKDALNEVTGIALHDAKTGERVRVRLGFKPIIFNGGPDAA